MVFITCWVAPCSAGCWCCMDNSVQPLHAEEQIAVQHIPDPVVQQVVVMNSVEESQPTVVTQAEASEVTVNESGDSGPSEEVANENEAAGDKQDNRPASATSTTSQIMETNTDELMDKTLQE